MYFQCRTYFSFIVVWMFIWINGQHQIESEYSCITIGKKKNVTFIYCAVIRSLRQYAPRTNSVRFFVIQPQNFLYMAYVLQKTFIFSRSLISNECTDPENILIPFRLVQNTSVSGNTTVNMYLWVRNCIYMFQQEINLTQASKISGRRRWKEYFFIIIIIFFYISTNT